jgi:plastocyanin
MRTLVLGGVVASLLVPSTALADETIVAGPGSRYAAGEYTIDQGEPLTFRNDDVSGPSHDVVSTANGDVQKRYLFASETIAPGKSSFVEGSQYLTTGSYDFFCSIHPSMKGKLVVNSGGTPKPRPGSTPAQPGEAPPAADQTPPEPSLSFGALRAATIKRRRSLTLRVGADEAVSMKVTVKVGKVTVARRSLRLGVRGTRTLKLAVGRSARRAIRRGRRLRIVVDVVDTAGNPGTATDSVTLQ